MRKKLILLLTAVFLIFFCAACGGGGKTKPPKDDPPTGTTEPEENKEPRERPQCVLSPFNESAAENIGSGAVDFSSADKGYVAARMEDTKRLKFQVIKGEETYTYDLPNDNTVTVFPLNMGSGEYEFRIMRNVEESKYTKEWTDQREVTISDEFQPFLRPNTIVKYDGSSKCVDKAYELTKFCHDDIDIAAKVYGYLSDNIVYDYDKAATVQSGYLPTPDETLATGTGICFDYAALAAAMLRSQGVPCQVITGYVGEDEVYHAWNRIFLETKGWLTVEISAGGSNWKRVDITYAAAGTPTAQIEDDGQYTTRYTY